MAWPAQGAPRGCFSPCDAVSHPPGPMPTGCCLLPSQHSAAVGRWQTAAVVSGRSKGPCQGYPARRNAFEVKEEFCTSSRECFLRLWKRRVLWVLFYFPSYFLKAEVFLEAPAANRCLWQMAARLLLSLLITLLLFSNWTPLLWGSMWLPRCCSPSLQRSEQVGAASTPHRHFGDLEVAVPMVTGLGCCAWAAGAVPHSPLRVSTSPSTAVGQSCAGKGLSGRIGLSSQKKKKGGKVLCGK